MEEKEETEVVCTKENPAPVSLRKQAQHPDAKMDAGPFCEISVTCPNCGHFLYANSLL